jgi:hypothetical protein
LGKGVGAEVQYAEKFGRFYFEVKELGHTRCVFYCNIARYVSEELGAPNTRMADIMQIPIFLPSLKQRWKMCREQWRKLATLNRD